MVLFTQKSVDFYYNSAEEYSQVSLKINKDF